MLVLSREKNQSIVIDDHIRVTVVYIKRNEVILGVEAPKKDFVRKREIYEAIKREEERNIKGSFYFCDRNDFNNLKDYKGEMIVK